MEENLFQYSWLSDKINDQINPNQFLDVFIQIENIKMPDMILDRSTCDSSNIKFECLSFSEFSNNFEEKTKEDIPKRSTFSPDLDNVSLNQIRIKKGKKSIKPKLICHFENCKMVFRHNWIYERHLNSHSNFKFFKCQIIECHKSYKSKENLKLHIKNIHEGIKPYQCSYCELKFSHRNGKFLKIIL